MDVSFAFSSDRASRLVFVTVFTYLLLFLLSLLLSFDTSTRFPRIRTLKSHVQVYLRICYLKTNRTEIFEETNFVKKFSSLFINKFEFAKLNSLHDEIEKSY